ncbi:MAG TPA: MFS transporter [Candidatus Kapabacteria bacterium]|nr:MFS transporter [Candidatus Kapabacteria bacterium]
MSNNKSFIRAWYWYDWAVSAFTTTIITVLIGPYLTTITKAASINGFVDVMGIKIFADSFVPYVISISVILQVFLLPYIGTISDKSNKKENLFAITGLGGGIFASLMYFIKDDNFLFGGALLLISNLLYGCSMVIYNSYLNDISEEHERDKISSRGYAYGYLGGGLLLALNLALISNAESLGISTGFAVRISLASAGIWWFIFALIPIRKLRGLEARPQIPSNESYLTAFINTIKELPKYPQTLIFLLAYIFYNDGIQAVIVVSSQFGQEALGLDISVLTTVILMVQFVAFLGAIIFEKISKITSTKTSLTATIVIWIVAILYAYFFLNSEGGFYILGAVIGLVLGGSQALSRSLFSILIPKGKEGEFYGIYEISERGTSWIGPLLFGLSLQFTSSYKFAILSLAILFVIGLLFLLKVDFKKGANDVGNSISNNITA